MARCPLDEINRGGVFVDVLEHTRSVQNMTGRRQDAIVSTVSSRFARLQLRSSQVHRNEHTHFLDSIGNLLGTVRR